MNPDPDYSAAYVDPAHRRRRRARGSRPHVHDRARDRGGRGGRRRAAAARRRALDVEALEADLGGVLARAGRRQPAALDRAREGGHPPGDRRGRQRRVGPRREACGQAAVAAAGRDDAGRDRLPRRLPLPHRRPDAGRRRSRCSRPRCPAAEAREAELLARRLPGLHDLGRLAGLRRRQDPAALPRGAGRRLDAVQDEGRGGRRGRRAAGGDHARGDRAGPDARGRRQPALGRGLGDRLDGPAARRSTRTGSRSRPAPTTSWATRRSPGPSRRSGSRPASTSTTGSCSSSSSRPGAMGVCQIDACRLGGVNEVVAVLLLAAKFGVPVCPHAGGVGLCELVQHLAAFDYIAVSGSLDGRMIEYVDHLHEHFLDPVVIRRGSYVLPSLPGYSARDPARDAGPVPLPGRPGMGVSVPRRDGARSAVAGVARQLDVALAAQRAAVAGRRHAPASPPSTRRRSSPACRAPAAATSAAGRSRGPRPGA